MILISGWAHTVACMEELRKRIELGLRQLPCAERPAHPDVPARTVNSGGKFPYRKPGGKAATLSASDVGPLLAEAVRSDHAGGSPVSGGKNGAPPFDMLKALGKVEGQAAALHMKSGVRSANFLSTMELWNENSETEPSSIYARNLKAIIGKTGGKTFLAGWSLGGMIALETAAKWPELVEGLILMSSTPKFCSGGDWPAGVPPSAIRAMLAGLKKNPRGVFETFFKTVTAPSMAAESVVSSRTESACAMDLREAAYGLEYLRDRDFRETAGNLAVPALILHGEKDSVVNVEAARRMNSLLANSRLRVYDAAGHDLPSQNPQSVADDIMDFIKRR